jgi:BMFP domain-containing protein YqiC
MASPLAAPVRVEAGPSAADRIAGLERRVQELEARLAEQESVVAQLKTLLA